MKKLSAFILALLAAVAVMAFAGCNDNTNSGKSGDVKTVENGVIFTAKDDIITLGDSTALADYLAALQENGDLTYKSETGAYGEFIVEVNGKRAEGSGYWSLYTDLVKIEGDPVEYSSTEWGSYEYGGKTLGVANFGASKLPCIAGYTYALLYVAG